MTKVPKRPVARIGRYLSESGWDMAQFARRCGLDKAHAWRLAKGRQAVSMATAIKIANATRAMSDAGVTSAEPIIASELCEALLALASNDSTAATGTHGKG